MEFPPTLGYVGHFLTVLAPAGENLPFQTAFQSVNIPAGLEFLVGDTS